MKTTRDASGDKTRTLIFLGGFIIYCILRLIYDINTADHFLGAALIAYGPYWTFEGMSKAREQGQALDSAPHPFWLLARGALCVAGGVLLIVG